MSYKIDSLILGSIEYRGNFSAVGCPAQVLDNDFSSVAIRCRIQTAQARANSSFESQSSNPEEAVAEYKRRYQRSPPRGFNEWVEFALSHQSKVIDDFDQIDRDLEPYRTPEGRRVFQLLNERKTDWPGTRRVKIDNGVMSTSAWYMYNDQWLGLVEPFVKALPDSVFYMSVIDEPRILSKPGPPPDQISFGDHSGKSIEALVKDSCAQLPREMTRRISYEKDVCQFSEPGKLHGLISSPDTFQYTHSLAPILSFGRMSAFRDILIPCPCYVSHPIPKEDNIPFLDKRPGLYWRGSSTGGRASRFNWEFGHRERFVTFIQSLKDAASVIKASQFFGHWKPDVRDQKKIDLFSHGLDVHMGAYIQCDNEACKDMERIMGPSDIEPEDTALNYRYLYDIDGNSMSTRFYRLLSQHAVVLKQSWFQEWHDDRLVPWVHFVPVTMGMEELPALMDFLVNDPEGERLSSEIAQSGSTWSRQVLRPIDMSIYIYRLLLEMAELYGSEDSFKGSNELMTNDEQE
ncbi:hypothetical protein BGW36DRAFT_402061 [Talaromyces proteolyticus]|uniref:Glycosyl transferase CAP10 domain-containing protein n=1 Tax=Talaromyces proteolyticus TaxID=1131652 RepID=A0AAD4KGK1_9EURO|nr:uncharacterized protein BGW36DRAFT_402061 [Talaromyces proteolyticus]KAH8689007.1 hypothetical protein BGW36DRAFT_402061 [Talaromyces proteolyticus]